MKFHSYSIQRSAVAIAAGCSIALAPSVLGQSSDEGATAFAMAPVANPILFEDAYIRTEVRPVFMLHGLPETFGFAGGTVPLGGEVRVYALQLRYAVTDRLGLIATKDGFIELSPKNTLTHEDGWANLAAGLKYALIDDRANQFILTPGFTLELPTGNRDVLQGRGSGEWNLFLSAAKGWDRFHTMANAGFRLPNDFSDQTAQAHYSLQLDYYACQYFIPFFVANGHTVLSEGDNKLLGAVDLHTELYDLINFGSTKAEGRSQVAIGGGFRSRLVKNIELGFAYEAGVTSPKGIFDNRFTLDLVWRF